MFTLSAKRSMKGGRNMSGILVLVKASILKFVTRIARWFEFGIVLRFDKVLFGSKNDYVYCCLYFPPESSPFYYRINQEHAENGLQSLEALLLTENLISLPLILCVDLNSRIAENENFISHIDKVPELHEVADMLNNDIGMVRGSSDKISNKFGCQLLKFCKSYTLYIVNGRFGSDKGKGDFTLIGQ